jgi:hypothetical protein
MAFLARCKKLNLVIFLVISFTVFLSPSMAISGQANRLQLYEETIKTGLIYNFLKYTTWPDDSAHKQRLRICLFGGDPLNGNLDLLNGKTAQQSVIEISNVDGINEMADCSLVFINRNSQNSLQEILAFLKDKHVLTISDIDQFAKQGGMVEMTMEDQRVTLYINKQALDRAGLSIQERLLKLAKLISG